MNPIQTIFQKNTVGKHELFEVVIPAGSTATRFQFPDVQNLRNTKLKGLQIYTDNEVPKSLLSNNAVITPSVIGSIFITLQTYDGREVIKQMPVFNLSTNAGFGVANLTNLGFAQFKNLKINYPKSYIEFETPQADPNNPLSVLFSAYYEDMTQEEMQQANTFKNKS